MVLLTALRNLLVRPPKALRIACVALFFLLIANLFFHGSKPYAVGLVSHPWDKLIHVTLFAVLATLARVTLPKLSSLWILLMIAAVALSDELYQTTLPGRSAGLADLIADITGALAALLAIKILRKPSSSI
jgi:VanZ family protein